MASPQRSKHETSGAGPGATDAFACVAPSLSPSSIFIAAIRPSPRIASANIPNATTATPTIPTPRRRVVVAVVVSALAAPSTSDVVVPYDIVSRVPSVGA